MPYKDRLITLKEAVIYSNHAEENIRLQIERGLLKKYDKNGKIISNPLSKKGFFRMSELMDVYNIKNPEKIKEEFFRRKKSGDSVKCIIPKKIISLKSSEMKKLKEIENQSIDTWILSPNYSTEEKIDPTFFPDLSEKFLQKIYNYLNESNRILNSQGNVLVHSVPRFLPYFGVHLEKLGLFFKYWIVYSEKMEDVASVNRFIPESNGILFFVQSNANFRINKVRVPYRNCTFCNKPLKDYGGKKHLRHMDGMVVSDIWHQDDVPIIRSNLQTIHSGILRKLIDLSCNSESTLLIAPYDGENLYEFCK